jgi:tetratricopeptide (TPR) repeat protein
MNRKWPIRVTAPGLLWCVLAFTPFAGPAFAQVDQNATAQLLGRAHTLEVRGRMDMARQLWQQVLYIDPNNTDALAGMARAARLEGRNDDAAKYESQIRAINPNDPNLQRLQNVGSASTTNSQLQEAGRLAQAGQYAQAMSLLRQVYGTNPPAGDPALAYYQTEAATDEGRPHAIAGLRSLMDKYPTESRYQIALGKILTYNPRTRAEGRKLLAKHPNDADAQEALRQSLIWDAQNPATAGDIRAYLAHHPDQQLQGALEQERAQQKAQRAATPSRPAGPTPTPEQRAAQAEVAARSAEDREAYAALNAHRTADAEARFGALLQKNAQNRQALAGMGYVRMQQSNFGGAISYLEQAQQGGLRDPAVEKALSDSRFYYTMQTATAALNQNDLKTAQVQFESALRMRPNDPTALEGLGGTLLKAQEAQAALPIFVQYVKAAPGDKAAYRGLVMAEYGTGQYAQVLAVDAHVPGKVRGELMRDPDYLRTLASAYMALGRDGDAQRVLKSALDLPFPASARGLKADVEMQYAALLAAAARYDQASGLYRQVLAGDSTNTAAWEGLVQTLHAQGRDGEALQVIQSMPASNYAGGLEEPGFVTTVAAVFQSQGHDDLAQALLEKFLAKQQLETKKPFVPAQVELAGLYLKHGDPGRAFPLYQAMIAANPQSVDAWKGLLSALHETHRDGDAVAELQQIPEGTRRMLEQDPSYLEIVAGVYAGVGQQQTAQAFLDRAEEHYAKAHIAPPPSIAIQSAWVEYNAGDDGGLYRSLMTLGSRTDLSDEQRLTVQDIWAQWSVRRANAAAARGDYRRAIAILNAAARSFPNNAAVSRALATGYASAGMPKEAVALFRAQDLSKASADDYRAAAGAGLAANDLNDTEVWLRFGLEQYPRDPQLLVLAGKFEAARGDANRAKEYYRAALKLMPAGDPGMELAGELHQPMPAMTRPAREAQPQDLATLLGQPDNAAGTSARAQPYLPGYNNGNGAPVQMNNTIPGGYYAPGTTLPSTAPTGSMATPQGSMPPQRLKDYMPPQSRVLQPVVQGGVRFVVDDERAFSSAARLAYLPASREGVVAMTAARYGGQQGQTADGTPIVNYAPVALAAKQTAQPPSGAAVQVAQPAQQPAADPDEDAAARLAAAIKANQAAGSDAMTGISQPPQENYDVPVQKTPAKVSSAQYMPGQGSQGLPAQSANPNGTDGSGQQYPQPRTGTSLPPARQTTPSHRRVHRTTTMSGQSTPAPDVEPTPAAAPPAPSMNYPSATAPLSDQAVPLPGPAVNLGQAPSDYELQQQQVPPLRGYYDPRIDPTAPLTPRQQTELDLATIDGSYSPWVGGSVIGRYRSGTPGIDRLAALSAPFEYSMTVNNSFRLTFIGMPVFLNSGQLNTQGGTLTPYIPLLGSLFGSAVNNPQQQFAAGVGGEVQVASNTFAAAVGVTPYPFLVTNVIGRGRWRPGNGHFTLFGGRDPVEETQLSYAGLHDPASATTTYAGNVWGGVVQTGGGVRVDAGNEHAGIYAVVEGGYLTGYHVEDNTKFDGTFGAYFNIRNWPQYGSLNIGGLFYGMHYQHNERAETYGLGGYFSPNAYFLAGVPVSFRGHSGVNLHYAINGSVGVQTFQESADTYYPLDPALQGQAITLCTNYTGSTVPVINRNCGYQPTNANTGLNFSIDSEVAYHVTDHWFVGGFLSANNTNNYNTVQGGFFVRYLFRPQYETTEYPTGLVPVEGLRPLRVP